jgi:aminoglycoside phosphotransferase (APT) family kinase protein
VIPHLKELVLASVPGRFATRDPSVVVLRGSSTVYLMFDRDPGRPSCVVHVGPKKNTRRSYEVLSTLHGVRPGLVAEPLACFDVGADDAALVEGGLPGMPWFRSTRQLRTREEWASLRARAIDVMIDLHHIVQGRPEWQVAVSPAGELARQWDEYRGRFAPQAKLTERVASFHAALVPLGLVTSHWQHGDFCINNLMVSDTSLAIIDLEEFGRTAMPLHDAFALAHSFDEMIPGRGRWWTLADHVERCTAGTVRARGYTPSQVAGLYLHHLLWRVNELAADRPIRWRVRDATREALAAFAEHPGVAVPGAP